jgi:predicted double-glycine peptidase
MCCVLAYYGLDVREEWIMNLAQTTTDGTSFSGILKVFDYYGFEVENGPMTPATLREAVDHKYPTIISLQAYRDAYTPWSEDWIDGHYVVAIGYDDTRIYFEDPSSYKRTWLAEPELLERWHDDDHGNHVYYWGCTVKGKPRYHYNDCTHMD